MLGIEPCDSLDRNKAMVKLALQKNVTPEAKLSQMVDKALQEVRVERRK